MRPAADEDGFVQLCDLAWYKWAFVLSIGGFLSLFLILFQPFGVSNHDPDFRIDLAFLASMLGVGFAVSAALATSEFVLRPLLLPAPGRRQLLAWLAWDYALVGTVAFLYYNHLGNWHDLSWPSYFGFLRDLALVMSMPVIGFLLYVRHDALVSRFRHLVASADSPASPPASRELVHFVADNEKDVFAVAAGQLLYLESQDNYLVVVHLEDGARSSRLIRSSLKRVEAMRVPGLARCHRSYMVNLAQVRSCGGNQHGLKLRGVLDPAYAGYSFGVFRIPPGPLVTLVAGGITAAALASACLALRNRPGRGMAFIAIVGTVLLLTLGLPELLGGLMAPAGYGIELGEYLRIPGLVSVAIVGALFCLPMIASIVWSARRLRPAA